MLTWFGSTPIVTEYDKTEKGWRGKVFEAKGAKMIYQTELFNRSIEAISSAENWIEQNKGAK